jgi:hypothetical protein
MWAFPFHLESSFGSQVNPSLSMKSLAVWSGVPFGRDLFSVSPISFGLPISEVLCSLLHPPKHKIPARRRPENIPGKPETLENGACRESKESRFSTRLLGLLGFIEWVVCVREIPLTLSKGQGFAKRLITRLRKPFYSMQVALKLAWFR